MKKEKRGRREKGKGGDSGRILGPGINVCFFELGYNCANLYLSCLFSQQVEDKKEIFLPGLKGVPLKKTESAVRVLGIFIDRF